MAAYTFLSSRQGLTFLATGLTGAIGVELKLTVTDVHDPSHADAASPTNTNQPGTDNGHGTWTDFGRITASKTAGFDILNSLPTGAGNDFYLAVGRVYRATLMAGSTLLPIGGAGVFHKDLDAAYLAVPADDSYAATLNHTANGFTVSATSTDTSIDSYIIITQGPKVVNNVTVSFASTKTIVAESDGSLASGSGTDETLIQGSTYEVQVIAENATGSVTNVQSFQVVPQQKPNVFSAFSVDVGSNVYGWSTDPVVPAVTAGKSIEVKFTAATAIVGADDTNYVISVQKMTTDDGATVDTGVQYFKSYTTAQMANPVAQPTAAEIAAGQGANSSTGLVISTNDAGWTTNANGTGGTLPLVLVNGESYKVRGKAVNKWGSGVTYDTQPLAVPSTIPSAITGNGAVGSTNGVASQTIEVTISSNLPAGLTPHDGGDDIDSYTVVCTPSTTPVAASQVVVTQVFLFGSVVGNKLEVKTGDNTLVNGTAYHVKVHATNSNGSSAPNNISPGSASATEGHEVADHFTPRQDPAAPTTATSLPHLNAASALGTGVVECNVAAATDMAGTGGDHIDRITYQFNMVGADGIAVTDLSDVAITKQTFENLNDGVSYTMKVRAVNYFEESGNWTTYVADNNIVNLSPSVPPTITDTLDLAHTTSIMGGSHNQLEVYIAANKFTFGGTTGGSYTPTGVRVTATNANNLSYSANLLFTNSSWAYQFIGNVAPGYHSTGPVPNTGAGNAAPDTGDRDDHEFVLTYAPFSAAYAAGDATTPTNIVTTLAGAHVHVSNTQAPITVTGVPGDGQMVYSINVPDWTATGNWRFPNVTGYTYQHGYSEPTMAVGGRITYPGATNSISYGGAVNGSNGSTAVTAGTNTLTIASLRNGTKYRLWLTVTAEEWHASSNPRNSAMVMHPLQGDDVDPEDVYVNGAMVGGNDMPYAKPTVHWDVDGNGVATGARVNMYISSNGRPVDDTILITSQAGTLGIINRTAILDASVQSGAAYYAAASGNPPFTEYWTGVGSGTSADPKIYSTLKHTATTGLTTALSTNSYILLTENDAGATIDAAADVTIQGLNVV
jgi:hypothetical protein